MSYRAIGQWTPNIDPNMDPSVMRTQLRRSSGSRQVATAQRTSHESQVPTKEGTVADLCQAMRELQEKLQRHTDARLRHPSSGGTISSAEALELLQHPEIVRVCEGKDPSERLHGDGAEMYYVFDEWLATLPATPQPPPDRRSAPFWAWALGATVVGGIAYVALKD